MNITIKGQVTIPQALRERFGLRPGTEVEFSAGDGAVLLRPKKGKGKKQSVFDQWLALAEGSLTEGGTTDDRMALTRGED
jgi:AbrB family looped-hinge helix DNA binding protein